MEKLLIIINVSMTVVTVLIFLIPKLKESWVVKRLFLALVTGGWLFTLFTSSWYLHWKFYDEGKLFIFFKQQPHIIKTENNLLNSFIVIIENNYKPETKIKDLNIIINSRMPLLESEILLSDCKQEQVTIQINDKSHLSLKVDEISGGQILCMNFKCASFIGTKPENVTMALSSVPFHLKYSIFGTEHSKTIDKGINVRLSTKTYNKKDILFEKIVAIDHRSVFTTRSEYRYCQFDFDNGLQTIEISCSPEKYIIIKYKGRNGKLKYKSKNKICPRCHKIDVLNMRVFKDGFFLIEETTEFERECV